MAKAKNVQKGRMKDTAAGSFQLNFEKGLGIAAFVLCTVHLTLLPFRYTYDSQIIYPYELWFGRILALAAVLYLIITRVNFPNTGYRIRDFFRRLDSPENRIAAGLMVWFLLSVADHQLQSNLPYFSAHEWYLFDMAINLLLLMPFVRALGRERGRQAAELMTHITVGAYTIFTIWALWNVFHLNIVTLPSGSKIGMNRITCLQFGCHYNITGAIALTMLALCVYMIFRKGKVVRALYLIAALAHLTVAMLSNSRTVFVAGLVMTVAAAFLFCWERYSAKTLRVRLAISAGAALVCGAIFWEIRPLTFSLFEHITHFKELLGTGGTAADDARELTSLSGRGAIWLASLKVMFSSFRSFLFGVTPLQTTPALMQIGGITFEVAHAHNAILQTGVALGVPAMLAFIVFHVLILLRALRILSGKVEGLRPNAWAMPVVVLCLVVMNLAEAYLISYYSVMSSVFFLFCGWTGALSRSGN